MSHYRKVLDRNRMKEETLKKREAKEVAEGKWVKGVRLGKIKITGPIISKLRQDRKAACKDMGITMNQYRKLEKKARRV